MIPPPAGISQAAFDEAAGTYDDVFENNRVTRSIRPLIQETQLRYFKPGSTVLELNCGTGTDAIFLAKNGIRVKATDASSRMIALAERKKSQMMTGGGLRFSIMPFEELHSIPTASYDGVFSNFGGLNCAHDMGKLASEIARVTVPGGFFLAGVMNKFCIWESAAFLLRGNGRGAIRRFGSKSVSAKVGDASVEVSYYTPGGLLKYLKEWFVPVESYGVNVLSPNPNSAGWAGRHARLGDALLRLDDGIRRIPPFDRLGDHFVIVARRNSR